MENYKTTTSNSNTYPENSTQQQMHYLDLQEPTKARMITSR
jgi:hypothetical protein